MNPTEIMELARLLKKLGRDVEVDEEDIQAYFPDISNQSDIRDFYLPQVPPNFYYNPKVLRRMVTPCLRF